jgi:pimeloyl-ACP methyl ester carboxylesterase
MRTSPEVDEAIRRMVTESMGMLSLLPRGLVRLPDWQAADRLEEIRVPTLTMWGDRDDPALQQIAARLTAAIPGARHVLVPAADHIVPMRVPDRFTDEVLAFLHQAQRAASEVRGTEPE